jgi:hypothetical protein
MRMIGAGVSVRGLWRELSPAQRRWIYLNALLITALINLLVNAGIAWASLMGERHVPLWSVPLVEKPSTVTDTVGTFFLLPLITSLLCTTAVWYDMARGRLATFRGTAPAQALVAYLPGTRLRRGLVLGVLCTVALAPLSVLVLVAIDFAGLTTTQFVLYKAALGVVLGAIVTPVIAVRAMADGPPRLQAPAHAPDTAGPAG